MTYTKIGIDGKLIEQIDPQTGKKVPVFTPILDPSGKEIPVNLYKSSRRQGTYFIGANGVGKSTSLRHWILEDIKQGIGVCVYDPHGDLIDDIIASLHKKEDRERVILLDALDQKRVFGVNVYQCDDPHDNVLVENTRERVEHLFELFWPDFHTQPQVSQGIRNSVYAFIDSFPAYHCTMLELPLLFTNEVARLRIASHLQDPVIADWWRRSLKGLDPQEQEKRSEMVGNRIAAFTTNRLLRPLIGQSKSTIDFRNVIDSKPGYIVLVKMYGDNQIMTQLIGALVIAELLRAALSRRDIEREKRRQFHVYCDEFELYATDDFTRLLKECRKYNIGMTIAHQSAVGLSLKNKAASLQVANIITGRMIPDDAEDIAGIYRSKGTVDTRTKSILAPALSPIGSLLDKRGAHKSPFVNKFVLEWLTTFNDAILYSREKTVLQGRYEKTVRTARSDLDFVRRKLDKILHTVMVEKNPLQTVPIDIFLPFAIHASGLAVPHLTCVLWGNAPELYTSGFTSRLIREGKLFDKNGEGVPVYTASRLIYQHEYYGLYFPLSEKGQQKFMEIHSTSLLSLSPTIQKALEAYARIWTSTDIEEINTHLKQLYVACCDYYITNGLLIGWHQQDLLAQEDIERQKDYLQQAQSIEKVKYWEERYYYRLATLKKSVDGNRYLRKHGNRPLYEWRDSEEYEEWKKKSPRILHEEDIEERRLKIKQAEEKRERICQDYQEAMREAKAILGTEIRKLRAAILDVQIFMQALAVHPVQEVSELVEEEIKQGQADREHEIKNELTGLPNGVVWCRVQNEDEQLEEHVITLTKSKIRMVEEEERNRRIEEIKERMLKPQYGYLRLRTDVEQEIAARQANLMKPGRPQTTQQEGVSEGAAIKLTQEQRKQEERLRKLDGIREALERSNNDDSKVFVNAPSIRTLSESDFKRLLDHQDFTAKNIKKRLADWRRDGARQADPFKEWVKTLLA